MRFPRIFGRTRRERAEAFDAFVLRTEASLARRKEERTQRHAAARAGQATRIHKAFEHDRLLNEQVQF
jgi:hypothetical protein